MTSALLPVLGLLLDATPHAGMRDSLVGLGAWCVPRAVDPARNRADAWFASSPAALERAGLDNEAPTAIWVSTPDEAAHASRLGAAAIVTCDHSALAGTGSAGVLVPAPGTHDVAAIQVMPPFVRLRLRRRSGLPERYVVDLRDTAALSAEQQETALAVAAAAVVPGDRLLDAMALGTPAVTDRTAAAAIGARDGVEVRAGSPGELYRLARDVAADLELAARLSRAGRRLVERDHDASAAHRTLATRLGLWPWEPAPWRTRIEWALQELRTPRDAVIRSRIEAMMKPLEGAAA